MNLKTHKIRLYPRGGHLHPKMPKKFYRKSGFGGSYYHFGHFEYALNYPERCYEFRYTAKFMNDWYFRFFEDEDYDLWIIQNESGGFLDKWWFPYGWSEKTGSEPSPLFYRGDRVVFHGNQVELLPFVRNMLPHLELTDFDLSVPGEITVWLGFIYQAGNHEEVEGNGQGPKEVSLEAIAAPCTFGHFSQPIYGDSPFYFFECFYLPAYDDETERVNEHLQAVEFFYGNRRTHHLFWQDEADGMTGWRWQHIATDHWDNIASPNWLEFQESCKKLRK